MAAPTSVQMIDALIEQVQNVSLSTGMTRVSKDAAWWPLVPLGHTGYTWGNDVSPHNPGQAPANTAAAGTNAAAANTTPAAPVKPAATAAAAPKKEEKKVEKKEEKKEEKKKEKGPKPVPAAAEPDQPDFTKLDIRVGQIVKAGRHPDPTVESLYVEEIDVGEDKPRQIVSGLVKYVPLEQFQVARVLVVCNLKPSPLKGVTSFGMVLAASTVNEKGEKVNVELVTPPAGAKPGDRVILEGEDWSAYPAMAEVDVKKKVNVWLSVKDKLKIDGEGKATFDGKRFVTQNTKQHCTSNLKDSIIS